MAGRRNSPTDVFKHLNMNPEPPLLCWLWTSGVNGKNLPYFSLAGKRVLAYRVVYKIMNPEWDIDNSREVMRHMCTDMNGVHVDNPLCCNPLHLMPGTHEQNMLDMVLRGRSGLTMAALRDIINLHKQFPELTQKQIADRVSFKHEINVSRQAVTDLLRGARHKALKDEMDKVDRELEESGNG